MELFRLGDEGSSVVLRIRQAEPLRAGGGHMLGGTITIDTPFVQGSTTIVLFPGDLTAWQQSLDSLDAGYDIAWHDHASSPWVYIERDAPEERAHITVHDPSMAMTKVTVTVPLTDAWFDDAYDRLERVLRTWPVDAVDAVDAEDPGDESESTLIDAVEALLYPRMTLSTDTSPPPRGARLIPFEVPYTESLLELAAELTRHHGDPVLLATHGTLDPTADATARPLLAPFEGRLVEMRAWEEFGNWVGCGTVRDEWGGTKPVVLVLRRHLPPTADELIGNLSWMDKLVAVTGWDPDRRTAIDWTAAEALLGTPLPSDYRELVERFGPDGQFDDYLSVYPPGRIADLSEALAAHEDHPPGKLLWWAGSEHRQDLCWLADGPDPDRWPVLHRRDATENWERYEGTATEFVFRMLTEPAHPYSIAWAFDRHWFTALSTRGEE
ncbi:DUF5959 family protein [Streptomyces sp. NPDC051561]|uniref:DUF5959 family protein n=1 Tax=Streptomyces sp. NPDC051561 TaxID=3365658 RepID=UPI00378E4311